MISKVVDRFKDLEKNVSKDKLSIVYVIIATLLFFFSQVNVKYLSRRVSPPLISQCIAISGIIIASIVQYSLGNISFCLPKQREHLFVILRNIFSFFGQIICFFFLLSYMPLSIIYVIYGITPILVFLMDHFIYHTHFKMSEILGCIISIIGIMLVLNPFSLEDENYNNEFSEKYAKGYYKLLCYFFCFCGCISFALANICVKEIEKVNNVVIFFYWCIIGVIILTFILMIKGNKEKIEGWDIISIFFINGFSIFFFMIFFTRALQIGKKGKVVVCNNMQLLYSYTFEILFLNEIPSVLKLLGSGLLVLGIMKTVSI